MYKRFFAFGCSYTKWLWPTWAHILAYDLKIPSYNYGKSGLGNVGIMHEILRRDIEHNFTDDDLIVVGWTMWNREDRYANGSWQAVGNIFNNGLYDKDFIKKYWSEENDIIKNYTAIIIANRSFNINYQFHTIDYYNMVDEYDNTINTGITKFNIYEKYMPEKNLIDNTINTRFGYKLKNDHHPDVITHMKHLKTFHDIKDDTEKNFTDVQYMIENSLDNLSGQNYDSVKEHFIGLFGNESWNIRMQ